MKTITLHVTAGQDGLVNIAIPASPNQAFEVVLVMQPVESAEVDALGWPVGYFERTYGSLADDPIDLGAPLPPPVRDDIADEGE